MFRIERRLVQVSSPARIPLIQVHKADKKAAAPKIEASLFREELPQEVQSSADNLLKQAQRQAEAQLQAAASQAEAKLEEAGQMAAARLAEAESQANAILEEAKRQGLQEGLTLSRRQTEEASQELSRLLAEMVKERETFFCGFEEEMVDLAFDIAEKIVVVALSKDDAAYKSMIENALKHMRREGKISLHVSEQQYNDFFHAESATFVLGDDTIRLSVVNDPHLKNGDLILESAEEIVNAGAASQFKQIELAFSRLGINA